MRDTSITAFHQLQHLSDKQQSVLIIIHGSPDSTDKEVAEQLNWPINCVTGRRNELEKRGYIVSSGTIMQPNGRAAHIWRVTK